jgi:hypothetical protein
LKTCENHEGFFDIDIENGALWGRLNWTHAICGGKNNWDFTIPILDSLLCACIGFTSYKTHSVGD